MPESFISSLDERCSALENFVENTGTQSVHWTGIRAPPSIRNSYGRSQSAIADSDRLRAAIHTPKVQDVDPSVPTSDSDTGRVTKPRGKRARENSEGTEKPQTVGRKGSSIHYGVRFRPDLRKWVAEIRVREWKDVDKKVWLGTFDTEDAAARGVDLARKLLKCTKKRRANLPCHELDLYSTNIPPHLDLTDIANDAMFKDVVAFVKNECQTYAARFSPTNPPVVPPQPQPTPNPLDYDEVDILWNDDNYELGLSDSELLILPPPRSDQYSTLNVGDQEVLITTDFDLSGIFEEAFQMSDCSPGSSAPPSFSEFQIQFANETARGASAMDMAVEPVCHDLADAAYLPQTWPGASSPSGGPLQLPVNTGLQSPLYGDGAPDMAYWTLQSEQFHFQMDMN